MERNIENWLKVINEAQYEDVVENYDGVYDSHLKAQSVVGPSPVNFLSDEAVASQTRHIHNRRKSSCTMRLLLPTDENIVSDMGDDGGDADQKS